MKIINKTSIVHEYPEPDKIQINESDLRLKLQEFSDAIKGRLSPFDFLVLVSAWAPVFISKFDGFADLSGDIIKGFYVAIIGLGTIYWIFQGKNTVLIWILKIPIRLHFAWLEEWRKAWVLKNETDSEKKVKDIKDRCLCSKSKKEEV